MLYQSRISSECAFYFEVLKEKYDLKSREQVLVKAIGKVKNSSSIEEYILDDKSINKSKMKYLRKPYNLKVNISELEIDQIDKFKTLFSSIVKTRSMTNGKAIMFILKVAILEEINYKKEDNFMYELDKRLKNIISPNNYNELDIILKEINKRIR